MKNVCKEYVCFYFYNQWSEDNIQKFNLKAGGANNKYQETTFGEENFKILQIICDMKI